MQLSCSLDLTPSRTSLGSSSSASHMRTSLSLFVKKYVYENRKQFVSKNEFCKAILPDWEIITSEESIKLTSPLLTVNCFKSLEKVKIISVNKITFSAFWVYPVCLEQFCMPLFSKKIIVGLITAFHFLFLFAFLLSFGADCIRIGTLKKK